MFTEPDYYPAAVDSQIGLSPGERMSVHDLLLALLLPSADDAAEDLAYNVGHGSVGSFIGMMNVRARELGLSHTHYSTPIGLDTPGNYSDAADLVKLASFLLVHHPFFAHAVALPSALLRTGNYRRFVTNRNTLVGRVPLDQRGQDRPHRSGRLRARRIRHAGRRDDAERGAGNAERGGARRRHAGRARLRLRQLPDGASGARRRRAGPADREGPARRSCAGHCRHLVRPRAAAQRSREPAGRGPRAAGRPAPASPSRWAR